MADFNYNAPQQQYGAAPVAPAAPEKKPFPVKIVAIAAAAFVALIIIIAAIAGSVPGEVKDEIAEAVADRYGYEVKGISKEMKISSGKAAVYVVSGKLKGEVDEDYESYEDYEKGYFLASVLVYDGEVVSCDIELYEKDDKDDMKDDIKEGKEELREDKKEIKEELEDMAEFYEELEEMEDEFEELNY